MFCYRWMISLTLCFISWSAFPITGKDCTEAQLRFSHFVDIETPKPSAQRKREMIEAQVQYLYGAMANSHYQGVPRGDYQVELSHTELLENNAVRVFYDYEGTVLLRKGPRVHYTFPLPRVPTREGIYDPAVDSRGVNQATDPHYQSFDDYWYFWNPTRYQSKLKAGIHYDWVQAKIERIKTVERSHPRYDQLMDPSGRIPITVMFGMDEVKHSKNANTGKDHGALGYRGFRKGLLELGFEIVDISPEERNRIFEGHRFRGFTLQKLIQPTAKGPIEVLLFFGPSGIDEPSRAFHYVFKDALENSSVVIYDGHSGLGAHLDIESIEAAEDFEIEWKSKEYQIFFMNSCSSYSYYNLTYHQLKGGKRASQYLDILTNGLETPFDNEQKANLALIRAVSRWATHGTKQSYSSLAKIMDDSNLFAINIQ